MLKSIIKIFEKLLKTCDRYGLKSIVMYSDILSYYVGKSYVNYSVTLRFLRRLMSHIGVCEYFNGLSVGRNKRNQCLNIKCSCGEEWQLSADIQNCIRRCLKKKVIDIIYDINFEARNLKILKFGERVKYEIIKKETLEKVKYKKMRQKAKGEVTTAIGSLEI